MWHLQMRQDNRLQKLNVPQLNDTVGASSITESYMQQDHTELGKQQKSCMKQSLGICPGRYCSRTLT